MQHTFPGSAIYPPLWNVIERGGAYFGYEGEDLVVHFRFLVTSAHVPRPGSVGRVEGKGGHLLPPLIREGDSQKGVAELAEVADHAIGQLHLLWVAWRQEQACKWVGIADG